MIETIGIDENWASSPFWTQSDNGTAITPLLLISRLEGQGALAF